MTVYQTPENQSFHQRVSSQTTNSLTYEIFPPTRDVSSPTIYTSNFGIQCPKYFSFAEVEKTRNNLYGEWIEERGISCMAVSSGYTNLAVSMTPQWIQKRG